MEAGAMEAGARSALPVPSQPSRYVNSALGHVQITATPFITGAGRPLGLPGGCHRPLAPGPCGLPPTAGAGDALSQSARLTETATCWLTCRPRGIPPSACGGRNILAIPLGGSP